MKKLILVLVIIFGLTQFGYSDSVNTYDINTDPLTTDYLLGIDDPSGTWTVERFNMPALIALFLASPTLTGTVVLPTNQAFLGSPTAATSMDPDTAGGANLGSTTKEWLYLYMSDTGIIYGQADQSATLTSSASLWTANNFAVTTQFKLPSSDSSPTATAGYLRHDSAITGFTNGICYSLLFGLLHGTRFAAFICCSSTLIISFNLFGSCTATFIFS